MRWKNFLHHVLLHLIALQCSLRCLLGLSELQSVHIGGCGVGGGVLHWLVWWKNCSHHVLLHLIALQCSLGCLLGLSELQRVHRADGGVGFCFLCGWFFVGSCCWCGGISSSGVSDITPWFIISVRKLLIVSWSSGVVDIIPWVIMFVRKSLIVSWYCARGIVCWFCVVCCVSDIIAWVLMSVGMLVNVSWYCGRSGVCWFCVVSCCCWGGGVVIVFICCWVL